MKKIKLILSLMVCFVAAPYILGGCEIFELRDKTYDGDKVVEFFPVTLTVDEIDESSEAATVVSSAINLISPEGTAQTNISFEFSVDDSSTAEVGTHYNIISPSPITIEQDTTSSPFQIGITANGLTDGETRVLFITLRGNDIVKPAENYKTLQVIIRGTDEDADDCPGYGDPAEPPCSDD